MDKSTKNNAVEQKRRISRNLTTKESREFWATVDRILKSRDPNQKPIKIGDPYLDGYKDISASLAEQDQ